jgi:uncharacterized protein YjdB
MASRMVQPILHGDHTELGENSRRSKGGDMRASSLMVAMLLVLYMSGCRDPGCLPISNAGAKATGITLQTDAFGLMPGDAYTLVATLSPPGAADARIAWKSDNDDVARVDDHGKVVALGAGVAHITASSQAGSVSRVATVTVPGAHGDDDRPSVVHATGVVIEQGAIDIRAGEQVPLTANVQPPRATNPNVQWRSSNPEVVIVSRDGIATALRPGSAVLTVVTNDGGLTAGVPVTARAGAHAVQVVGIGPFGVLVGPDGDVFIAD